MSGPVTYLDGKKLRQTLTVFLDHVLPACGGLEYRLVGTGAALLHGVSLPVGDVDILVRERQAVDAFSDALSAFQCLEAPTWLPETRQYYANHAIHGVELGISTVEVESDADTIETFGRGPWEYYTPLPCGGYQVPTVALELRLITELYRDRADRYEAVLGYLEVHGCDLGFLRRGLDALGLPQTRLDELLRRLERAPFKALPVHRSQQT